MTRRPGKGYRYGRWRGGPDPLAPPYDLGDAVDEIGDSVLGGSGVREALRELLRRGMAGRRGLDDLRRNVRDRLRQARQAGRLDGTLQEVRELLDKALEAERRELFPDPDDSARLAEAELDALPQDTAGAVRELKDYPWRSEEARQAYQQIQDTLRREVLDSSFASMKQALENAHRGRTCRRSATWSPTSPSSSTRTTAARTPTSASPSSWRSTGSSSPTTRRRWRS